TDVPTAASTASGSAGVTAIPSSWPMKSSGSTGPMTSAFTRWPTKTRRPCALPGSLSWRSWLRGDCPSIFLPPFEPRTLRGTPTGRAASRRALVEPDQRKWDYRHQVLAQRYLRPWQLFAWVKWFELWFHLRPSRLCGMLRGRDRFRRRQSRWVFCHIGLVWLSEVLEFLSDRLLRRD